MIHAMFPISSAVPASFPLQGPGAFVSCFYKYNRHFSSPEAIEKCLFFVSLRGRMPAAAPQGVQGLDAPARASER